MTHFLNWMKNSLRFTYNTNTLVRLPTINIHKYEDLSYRENTKMCDPMLVTLSKMRPHYSQTSREKATPSSGTSPLASYRSLSLSRKLETVQWKKPRKWML